MLRRLDTPHRNGQHQTNPDNTWMIMIMSRKLARTGSWCVNEAWEDITGSTDQYLPPES
jgi:hypothetical protein